MENDVIVKKEIILCSSNSCIPFARKIGKLFVALSAVGEIILQFHRVGSGINDLMGINAGQRIAGDVSGVVKTRLDGTETNFRQPGPDVGQVLEQHTTELQVLAGCDIAAAVVSVARHDGGDGSELSGIENTVRNPQAEHEQSRSLGTPEESIPLEPELQVGLINILPAQSCKLIQLAANGKAVLGSFVLLDLV
jgi:hypothetical protein